MIKTAKFILITSLVLFIIILLGFKCVVGLGQPLSANKNAVNFTIEKGQSLNTIAENLQSREIIRSAWYFELYAKIHNLRHLLQAGTYELSSSQSAAEILDVITKGNVVDRENVITIIPGWSMRDIDSYFLQNNFASSADLKKIDDLKVGSWNLDFSKPDFLVDAPKNASLEGYLYPDTYRVFKDATAEDIAHKALDNFGVKLTPQMRTDIASQGKSIYEVITMASIVEKEVKTYSDMQKVSDIFWRRVHDGVALGSDATLSYALSDNEKQHSGNDLELNSPYNTYKYKGLPPGPICNPSLNAIKAAIYPQSNDDYYFLTRPDTGETIFSRNYQEHLQNKAKYLK